MGEGSLSQDEIDALLQGAEENPFELGGFTAGAVDTGEDALSPIDRDIISDTLASCFQMAGNVLGTILAKSARFSNPITESRTYKDLSNELGNNTVCLYSQVSGIFNGRVSLVMAQENASKIAGIMMGGGSSPTGLDMAQIQTLKDCLSPVMGTITAQLGIKLGGTLSGSPPEVVVVNSPSDLRLPEGSSLVKTQFTLNIETIGSFKVSYILSKDNAQTILDISKSGGKQGGGMGGINIPVQGGMQMGQGGYGGQPQIGIKGVSFPSLASVGPPSGNTNLNLLMDVQMSVTVELGRTKMYIKDILGLGEGSIIELDKLAGEPVDLLVNGKLIAKGEVVVIDENFGVRVTDIVSPQERIKTDKS